MDASNDQTSPKRSQSWRSRAGNFLIAVAGGIGVNLISNSVGYRGVAISAAAGAVLLGAVQLRRFPEQAPLVVMSSWTMLVLGAASTVLATVTSLPWSGYAVLGAALFTLGAAVIPLDRYRVARTLGGVACIGLGVSAIGIAIGLLDLDLFSVIMLLILPDIAGLFIGGAVALAGIGISLIVAGIAFLLHRTMLLVMAGVGLGVSLIGTGIALLSFTLVEFTVLAAWLIAAGVVIAIGTVVAFPLVRGVLLSIASIGLGVSAIIGGIAFLLPPSQASDVGLGGWLIGVGVFVIATGLALLLGQDMMVAVASAGFGISLIGTGVAIQSLGWTAIATWLIVPGVIAIGAGAAALTRRPLLINISRTVFGTSLVGAGVAILYIQGTLIWVEGIFIGSGTIAAIGIGVTVGAWLAIGVGVSTVAAGVNVPLPREILTGIFGICVGISLTGAGITAGIIGATLPTVWLIGSGISITALAVARLRKRYMLGGAAAIGFGISLAVLAVYFFVGDDQLEGAAAAGAGLASITVGLAVSQVHTGLRNWFIKHWAVWTQAPGQPLNEQKDDD